MNTDLKSEETDKPLGVGERLDRLERLIVRLLLSTPAGKSGSQLIDVARMSRPIADTLNKRFFPWAGDDDKAEAAFAVDSVLDICAGDISIAQDEQVDVDAEAKRIKLEAKRAEAEAVKRAAEETARAAQAELDSLTN